MHVASERWYQWAAALFIGLCTLAAVFPLYYIIVNSLAPESELAQGVVIIPHRLTWAAYRVVLTDIRLLQALGISILRTAIGSLGALAFTTIGAYVLARKGMPGRKLFIFMVLITILFNGGMVPTYLVVAKTGLIDSIWALIVPLLVDSWGLLVIKQFFENMPESIDEAARIDGASELQFLLRIGIPVAKPALAAIGLFNAVGHWNAWFDAMLYLNNPAKYPLQLVLRNLLQGLDFLRQNGLEMSGSSFVRASGDGLKMAIVILGTLPILCVYPFLQKHFTKGIYLGAVKG